MSIQYTSYRWIILSSYVLTGIISQLIWITFAPILPIVTSLYGVSEGDVGLLSAVFPLIYIIISIPVGYYIDSKGYRKAILIGAGFLGLFGFLRAFPETFIYLLILQTLAAIGQPFIMNSISKLVKAWFPPEEAGLATGIGSLSLFIGIILGLVLTPYLVNLIGYRETLIAYGVFSILVALNFYIAGKEPEVAVEEGEMVSPSEFLRIIKNRNIVILAVLFFIGIGIFTAFTTWVEPILTGHKLSTEMAGTMGGLMIIGGIMGSLVIPGLSDKYRTRKKPLIIALAVSAVLWYSLTELYTMLAIAINLFVLGFFFMSLLPLALELSAESVEKRYIGTANSILWEFSQIGAFILIILYEVLAGSYGWNSTLILSSILIVLSLLLSSALMEKMPPK